MTIQLYNIDVLDGFNKLEDKSIDCIITSPPYWKGFEYESYFNSYNQYLSWCEKWLKECKRVLKEEGYFFLNVANDSETTVRSFELLKIATENLMFKLHDTIIWYCYNRQPANTTRQLTNQCEYIFMFRHKSAGVELQKKQYIVIILIYLKLKMWEMFGKYLLIVAKTINKHLVEKKQNRNGVIVVSH